MQDLFVARQPIFDQRLRVVAYELLFRDSPINAFPGLQGDQASARTIHDALNVFGLEALAGHHGVYINVTRNVLLGGLMLSMPPARTTVELLETVPPDPEVIAACRSLKQAGFTLALDDFIFSPGYEPLLELADVVKVDFLQTRGDERRRLVERYGEGRSFLAEKIESPEEQLDAVRCGYSLFQGYFFARPQMMTAREIPALKVIYLRLLQQVNDADFDAGALQQTIKQDVALSVKLLTYLNSAMFGWRQRVTSIQHALVLLGERPFRKWVAVLAAAGLSEQLPREVAVTALVRARFCEQLALPGENDLTLFLLGLLSLLDVMTGRPMAEGLERLRVSPALREALLERKGVLGAALDLAAAFERADWGKVASLSRTLNVPEPALSSAYRAAVAWADEVFSAA